MYHRGYRRCFSQGKIITFIGYDKGEDRNLITSRKQARIIEFMYSLYILEVNSYSIVRYLEKYNVPTTLGKENSSVSVGKSILTNEKYKGDALLQKCFTVNYITKQKKKSEGELPQYYVEDNHEAIIPRKIYDFVQKK